MALLIHLHRGGMVDNIRCYPERGCPSRSTFDRTALINFSTASHPLGRGVTAGGARRGPDLFGAPHKAIERAAVETAALLAVTGCIKGEVSVDGFTKAGLKSDMVVIRKFIREFPRYKQLAEAGKVVELVDRKGKRFTFAAEKPRRASGAAKHMAKGNPLSPEPVPRKEWGENY